jgi:putative ABC transport system permease protein
MKAVSIVKNSFSNLKSNKSRSALTILGIVIGITAVIMMISIGGGAQNLILGQVASFGSNNLFVEPGAETTNGVQALQEQLTIKTLKIKDLEDIQKNSNVSRVAPLVLGVDRIVYNDKNEKVTFYGTTSNFFDIMNGEFALGHNFLETNPNVISRDIILGYKIKKDLFGDQDPIGKIVRIQKTNFRVIGILAEKGTQLFLNLDEYVYVPVASAQKLLLGIDFLRNIVVQLKDENKIDETTFDLRLILRQNHHIYNPSDDLSKDDFKIASQKQAVNILGQVTSIFTIFLSSVAAIALIVGGIGIMNIMLVSVTERTKEIGLRKAVGAKSKDILYQFLSEAITLTLLGGIIGIILGVGLSLLTGLVLGKVLNLNWGFFISFPAILLGFSVSTIIGLVFGIYPSQKASRLDPIQALRYE